MKILYGVQGTGNGHITRARAMQVALNKKGIEVDWVFSGRERSKFFDMDAFGDYQVFKGLTFATRDGKIDLIKTFAEASLGQVWQDVRRLEVSQYDIVITDFEPVVAWAAKKQGVPCIGLGHQYAFDHDIPKAGHSVTSQAIMKWFAPVSLGIGVHWHHFNQPILPPIIESEHAHSFGRDQTLVYLPFEKSDEVLGVLKKVDHAFIYHCADIEPGRYGNVEVKGFSRAGFKESLFSTDGVICNAGFELASEALNLGRRLLVKPLIGQMEQASNALALTSLGLGQATERIDVTSIQRYLIEAPVSQVNYPNVPERLADWLLESPRRPLADLVKESWLGVQMPQVGFSEDLQAKAS